ncbi:AraC family transcriptional regulator [Paraburkholderia caribensis]|uniref:AraC family transcriptional regulator n=2 Tax=Paraburkholderia caribensis TaxID=75105 RepID=A0A9Q6S6A8_9BURK|nr:AraC family transcriptional regulator [Paraburkholderia caribensis]QLB65697.1 AraC family transcriptional regulator [Paraburkholderia caribensis]
MFVGNNLQWVTHQQIGAISATQRIAFVLTESCDLLGIGAIAEALECACSLATGESSKRYEMRFLSEGGGHVKCDRSLFVSTDDLPKSGDERFAHVFVAGGMHSRAACDTPALSGWLQRMRANGARVKLFAAGFEASNGTYDKGTVNGYEQARRRRAQLGSAVKAAFEVIRADFGESVAHEALRRTSFVDSSEWLSSSMDAANTSGDRIRAAARWLQDNCHRAVTVNDAAEACAMSQRTLLRNFQTHIGASPSEYLQRVRIERACQLLAETSLPADKVARRVGLTNGDRLGKLFRRCVGKSPIEYRAWTRGNADAKGSNGETTCSVHQQPTLATCDE